MKETTEKRLSWISLLSALTCLTITYYPGLIIHPIDYIYEFATGIRYVDITTGMVAYFFIIPLILISILVEILIILIYQKRLSLISSTATFLLLLNTLIYFQIVL